MFSAGCCYGCGTTSYGDTKMGVNGPAPCVLQDLCSPLLRGRITRYTPSACLSVCLPCPPLTQKHIYMYSLLRRCCQKIIFLNTYITSHYGTLICSFLHYITLHKHIITHTEKLVNLKDNKNNKTTKTTLTTKP